ncbi:MAG: hypothetical protein AB7F76_04030 [Parvibaculaceae bacterium]
MTTMLEKVARAIAASQGHDDWRRCIGSALAAMSALREPTAEMLEAATYGLPDFGYLPEEWQAMIDHVLNENEP